MKRIHYNLCFLVLLIIFFAIINRGFFYNKVAIYKFAETKQNPEMKSVVTEIKPDVETKKMADESPSVIPVVTRVEAEELNEEALVYFKKTEMLMAKERERVGQGFRVAYSEQFRDFKTISLSKTNEEQLSTRGYELDEFKKREIPSAWSIDYSTIPSNADFKKNDDGYNIISNEGVIRFLGQSFNGMRGSFLFELTVRNNSDKDSEITFGVHDSNILNDGYRILSTEVIHSHEEKTIEAELGGGRQNISPIISVNGTITLSKFDVYKKEQITVVEEKSVDLSMIEVEGEIMEVSKLINPKQSDYPDCYYMTSFEVKRIISGSMPSGSINLSVPGFKDYKLTSFRLRTGDKIKCRIIPEEFATEEERKVQVCDDFNYYERDTYFLQSYNKITEYSGGPLPVFTTTNQYKSAWAECFNPPQTARSIEKRKQAIQDEKTFLDSFDTSINVDSIQARWDKDQISLPQIKPNIFWFQKGNSVYALPKNIKDYINPDIPSHALESSIPALVALKEYLQSQNVDLIIVLYPDIYSVAIRAFYRETIKAPIQPSATIAKALLENDIEVIDLAPRLFPLLESTDFLFYYYHLNVHPGWETQQIAGKLVAERLKRYDLMPSLDPDLFQEKEVLALDETYLYPENLPIGSGKPGEPVKTKAIFYNNTSTGSNPSSPIVLWGNSFLAWPKNYAFATSVAKYSLNFCDIQRGSGCFTTMIRDLLLSPQTYIKNKKVVVIPINVSWLSILKIWNIREMESNLVKSRNLLKRIPVSLPAANIEDERIMKSAKDIGIKGSCYSVSEKNGFHILLPIFEKTPGTICTIEISYYNKGDLTIQYGRSSENIPTTGKFIIESTSFDYIQDVNELVINASANTVIFIQKIDICEYKISTATN